MLKAWLLNTSRTICREQLGGFVSPRPCLVSDFYQTIHSWFCLYSVKTLQLPLAAARLWFFQLLQTHKALREGYRWSSTYTLTFVDRLAKTLFCLMLFSKACRMFARAFVCWGCFFGDPGIRFVISDAGEIILALCLIEIPPHTKPCAISVCPSSRPPPP